MQTSKTRLKHQIVVGLFSGSLALSAAATDQALLDILLANGVITEVQHAQLTQKEDVSSAEVLSSIDTAKPTANERDSSSVSDELTLRQVALNDNVKRAIDNAVVSAVDANSLIKASYGSKGFRFETRDGNFQTNLQWRAQMRYTNPYASDPRQASNLKIAVALASSHDVSA